jgi:hemerythrin-like domain-containing protein
MEPIQILINEHKLIRQYLNDSSVALFMMEEEKWPEKEFFEIGVEFTKSFSDKYHHFKEEYIMFLKLSQKKQGTIDSEIMFLRDQHERARNFTIEISRALSKYTQSNDIHTHTIAENLGYYNLLLRQHIHREDHVFYPMAHDIFTDSEQKEMLEDFEKAEDKFLPNFLGFVTGSPNISINTD